MDVIPLGSKEHLIVEVKDRTGSVTTLNGKSPVFTVKDDDDVVKYSNQAATNVGMNVYCLVDTAGWDPGKYRLWVAFTNAPETPKIGPYEFRVAD